MESFAPFLVVLSIVVPVSVCSVLIARIYRKNAALDPKITTKLRKQQDEYITELEQAKRKLQNKLNGLQKGPSIVGDKEDIGGIIPQVVDEISAHLPKWAQNLVKSNPDLVSQGIDLLKKNPDKAKDIIGRFIKTKPDAQETQSTGL